MLRIDHHFNVVAERVFDAWLNCEGVGKWLFATPAGRITRVEIDPRVGGKFIIVDRREGEDVEHVGEYLEVDRPTRLVFTFAVPKYSSQSTRVSIDIGPTPSGCELTLTHEGVPAEWIDRTKQGWTMILDGLAKTLGDAIQV